MRMSSGASAAYENPRSGRSICIDETPRSSRIASARTPLSASWRRTTEKLPRSSRAWAPARRRNRSKYGRTLGSRSMAISLPLPRRPSARIAACPPAPNVASTTVSFGRTASRRRTSSARTGTWSVSFGCKTLGNMLRAPFDLLQVLAPDGAVPDLQVVVDSRDDDLAAESRVLDQRGRNVDPPLLVRLGFGSAREEVPVHQPCLLEQRVELGEPARDEVVPLRPREEVQASVEPTRDHAPVHEGIAELGRKRETVLVIEGVCVFAEEHA